MVASRIRILIIITIGCFCVIMTSQLHSGVFNKAVGLRNSLSNQLWKNNILLRNKSKPMLELGTKFLVMKGESYYFKNSTTRNRNSSPIVTGLNGRKTRARTKTLNSSSTAVPEHGGTIGTRVKKDKRKTKFSKMFDCKPRIPTQFKLNQQNHMKVFRQVYETDRLSRSKLQNETTVLYKYMNLTSSKHSLCQSDAIGRIREEQTIKSLNCSKGRPSIVFLNNNTLLVNSTKVSRIFGKIDFCRYASIVNTDIDDSNLSVLKWSRHFLNRPVKLSSNEENILVRCYHNNDLVAESYLINIDEKTDEKVKISDFKEHLNGDSPLEVMNVVMIGMDGMSKHAFGRTMPKTRNYILKQMKARELYDFNRIGESAFPNVIPLLSGLSETDISSIWNEEQYFDDIEEIFLWNQFQKCGYRTSVGFDMDKIPTFHYLKRGWRRPTFDYYSRPLVLQINVGRKRLPKDDINCVGERPELEILHDSVIQLAFKFNNSENKPYFVYNFYAKVTRDNPDLARAVDEIYLTFFEKVNIKGLLHNTLMVFFSDHGARFGTQRHTFQGKVEVNTPFVFFIFPNWFEQKYPQLMQTFEINQNRLTTFFDIHTTLTKLLKFDGKTGYGNINDRGISLFDEIPVYRTCQHAEIPIEYCNHRYYSNETVPKNIVDTLSCDLLGEIVLKTSQFRENCTRLVLNKIVSILKIETQTKADFNLLNIFMKSKKLLPVYYEVSIETYPNNGLYDALYKYENKRVNLIGDIVRLNAHDGQDVCDIPEEVKPFCHYQNVEI